MATDENSEIHYGDRMSDSDNLMWIIEHDPQLRSTITMLTLLDGSPDRGRLQHRIERATRRIPRLRQRVVANPHSIAPPRWEVDPSFTLSYHLRYMSLGGQGSLAELIDVVEPIAMQSFDRARPLWEFTFVEGLVGGRSALIMKVHHTVTDGVGGVQLMLETFSLEPDDDDGAMPDAPEQQPLGQPKRAAGALRYEAQRQRGYAKDGWALLRQFRDDPIGTSRTTADIAASTARTLRPTISPLSPLWSQRSLKTTLDTYALSVPEMRAAGTAVDAKLNDIFVTGLCRAAYLYHDRFGEGVNALRMGMPINTRTDKSADEAGNQFTPARFEVPIAIKDPAEHVSTIRALIIKNRNEPAVELTSQIAGVLTRLPKSILTNVFGMMLRGVDFMASNVPGIPVPAYLVGVPVIAQYPFGPVSGAALNVTLLSYCDQAFLGINADTAAIENTAAFHTCLEDGFAPLLALA